MAPASLMFFVGGELVLCAALASLDIRTPFRISSLPKGVPIRPGIYTIAEDIIAVDAGAGRAYREALDARYQASPLFRRMLYQLNLFWVFETSSGAALPGWKPLLTASGYFSHDNSSCCNSGGLRSFGTSNSCLWHW